MTEISVVIPTFNSSETLGQCLSSVWKQSSLPAEVIVVDRFSRDGTAEIALANEAKVIQSCANRSLARNIGASHASSSAILFIDSDMILPSLLIEECEAGLEKHHALVLPESSIGRGFWGECKSLERLTHDSDGLLEAARCFRKDSFLVLGGYNPRLEAGEDWDLHIRCGLWGLSTGKVSSRILHDEGSPTLLSLMRKKYRYGRVMRAYFSENPYHGIRQTNPVTRIIVPGIRVARRHPTHGFGVTLLKSMEFTSGAIGWFHSILQS